MNPKAHHNPDEYLYRYRSMNSIGLDRVFTHNELYFVSPKDLNDPFDCDPPINFADSTVNDFMVLHNAAAYDQYNTLGMGVNIKPYEVEESIRVALTNNQTKFIREKEADFRNILMEMSNKLGILCLSATPFNILMWSHYADKHKGVVLQFERKGLKKRFNYLEDVKYKNNIIDVKILGNNLKEWDKLLLLNKSSDWNYEEEWRIITEPEKRRDKHINPRVFRFPKEILTGIILGCEISKADKDRITMWRNHGCLQARIYEAIRNNHSYAVNIDFDKWT